MIRALRASTPDDVALRAVLSVAVLFLLLVPEAAAPAPAQASSGAAAALRGEQRVAEASMLRADRQIERLERARRQHHRRLQQAKRQLARAIERRDVKRHRLERLQVRLGDAEHVLARAVRVRPDPTGRQATDRPTLRKRIAQLDRQERQLTRATHRLDREVQRARTEKQARLRKTGARRIQARKAARERAEDRLGAAIMQSVELAQARASERFTAASATRFRKPAAGTLSQRYGCTGYRANPSRGACAHFHDGIDIALRVGSPVRASADGYVAYVGRNPWDRGRRAYVVIIGHAAGYETIYAHLQPRRVVHTGQPVRRGDLIGRVGTTGRSSGPHVHWEVSRSFATLDPLHAGG